MPLNNTLAKNIDTMGAPTKKQKLEANTPLKHFLRPIIEEAMLRRKALMEQQQPAPMGSPLQGALMNREEMF